MSGVTEEEIDAAIARIALTADGMLLYRRLVRVLCSVSPYEASPGTLPINEGRRRFAAELKRIMDPNANLSAPSDRRDSDALESASSPQAGRKASVGPAAGRRRVEPYAKAGGTGETGGSGK